MRKPFTSRPYLGAATALVAATAGIATSAETDGNADLQQQIIELRAEVARLRAGDEHTHWLTDRRADEVRSLVHEVLADADTRASLLGSGMTAGYDGGFYLGSADGNYRLQIAGRQQFRYVYNFQSDPGDFDDRHRSGFENRRTRLAFSGHIINPQWTYQIQGDFSRSGGGFTLLDANLAYRFDNGMRIRVGQFRQPFMREDDISSGRQQAIERSLVNARFSQGRTQGVELSGRVGDNFGYSVTFSEGFRNLNTPWQAETTEFAFTGKVEYLVAGNWRQFRDFSSWSSEEFGVLLGLGGHWQRGEYGTDTASNEIFRVTADAMVQFGGANIFGAVVMNHQDIGMGGGNVTQWGVVIQGGFFFVPDKWEAFARYEWGDLDTMGVEDLSLITAGVNYYFAGHNLKWQTDIGVGINEIAPQWASSSAGWRADAAGEDSQLVIRSQIQFVF